MIKVALATTSLEELKNVKCLLMEHFEVRTDSIEQHGRFHVTTLKIENALECQSEYNEMFSLIERFTNVDLRHRDYGRKANNERARAYRIASYLLRHRFKLKWRNAATILGFDNHVSAHLYCKWFYSRGLKIDVSTDNAMTLKRAVTKLLDVIVKEERDGKPVSQSSTYETL